MEVKRIKFFLILRWNLQGEDIGKKRSCVSLTSYHLLSSLKVPVSVIFKDPPRNFDYIYSEEHTVVKGNDVINVVSSLFQLDEEKKVTNIKYLHLWVTP